MILITTNNNFMFRSSQRKCQRRCSVKKAVFKKFTNFTDLQAFNFIKKRLQHRCFPVKFAKFLRTLILKYICKRLLLYVKINPLRFRFKSIPWYTQQTFQFTRNWESPQGRIKNLIYVYLMIFAKCNLWTFLYVKAWSESYMWCFARFVTIYII